MAEGPNILLIVLDTARRDALEPYGAPTGASPAIAELAARGRALEHVYATGCWTAPSHASMFTGLLPRAAGMSRVPSIDVARPVMRRYRSRVLPEVMRRNGYGTAAVTSNVWVSAATGLDFGFDEFVFADTGRHGDLGFTPSGRLRFILHALRGRADDGAEHAEQTLASWIARPQRRPFFWFANLGRPVVATGRGGSIEYLRDEENCVLFAVDDHESLANAVKRLASNAELRDRLRTGGLETAPRYTEMRFNQAVERLVTERLTARRARATVPTGAAT